MFVHAVSSQKVNDCKSAIIYSPNSNTLEKDIILFVRTDFRDSPLILVIVVKMTKLQYRKLLASCFF